MADRIAWESEMQKALKRARNENKFVLLDFYNPGWIGCQQMDAVTYPDKKVISFINQHFIPLRIQFDAKPHAVYFNVKWTPTLITLDKEGNEHYRTLGFLSAEDLIPALYLAIGKTSFDSEDLDKALEYFDNLLAEYPESEFAAEGMYLQGVSKYKSSNDPIPLKQAYEDLNRKFPKSEWTKRAYPYRLIT